MCFSSSRKIAKARQQFLEAVKAVNEGKVDKNAPFLGILARYTGKVAIPLRMDKGGEN